MTPCTRQAYVNAVATHYVRLPGTPTRASRRDRHLAAALYDRGIPLHVVWAAFVIAAARRTVRAPAQPQLEPVRTLYYFLPTIDEVLATHPDPDYVRFLAEKLAPFVSVKQAVLADLRRGQIPALPDGR